MIIAPGNIKYLPNSIFYPSLNRKYDCLSYLAILCKLYFISRRITADIMSITRGSIFHFQIFKIMKINALSVSELEGALY